jgi:hypothetical protein
VLPAASRSTPGRFDPPLRERMLVVRGARSPASFVGMEERVHPLLAAIVAALSGCTSTYDGEGCLWVPEAEMSCPSRQDVAPTRLEIESGCKEGPCEIVAVKGEGRRSERYVEPLSDGIPDVAGEYQPACCYPVEILDHEGAGSSGSSFSGPTPGRPFYDGGAPRSAPLVRRGGAETAPSPRAVAWARAGAGEHASVAAFSRLVLELMALGAPSSLLAEAHQAALDEIRHADVCWAFARELGLDVNAGGFPFDTSPVLDVTLEALAAETVRDGCVAESLGALLLEAAARAAPDANVRSALAQMAREEAQHAVFSYRVVAWVMAQGHAPVRRVVQEAFRTARVAPDLEELALRAGISVEILRDALHLGIVQVLEPATAALLAA